MERSELLRTHMKKRMLLVAVVTLGVAAVSGSAVGATAQEDSFTAKFAGIRAPEIPAKAAALVAQAPADQQETTAVSVVQAASDRAPAATPEIVGGIVRQAPATAPAVAAAAAEKQPKQAAKIAATAAASAPAEAGKIVAAVCKKVPASFSSVVMEVSRALPKDERQALLAGLVEGVPSLKPFVERATFYLASLGNREPSLSQVLAYTSAYMRKASSATGLKSEALLAQGLSVEQQATLSSGAWDPNNPNQGVRFVPGGGKPGETNRAQTVVVEKGKGRDQNYSTP